MPRSCATPAAPDDPRRRRTPCRILRRRRPGRHARPRREGGGDSARAGPSPDEAGFATAEVAVALPAVVLVTLAAMWGVSIASAQLSCTDAARAGARAAARGESLAVVHSRVTAAAPKGSTVQVHRDGESTRVEVTATVHAPVPTGLPPAVLHARALSATEPGAATP
ncbi:TadE family type IV pilus minor pilin [Thermomonospora amylolytica]|uniref:TadE family type IV pilus minor pilin n=1 Tax=Thermomonospora amylolytica TaxID=1411117 RepID=UPI000E6C9620|nr:TadE family type IV pilus minor pilin [Thermomonospora amylolytica]